MAAMSISPGIIRRRLGLSQEAFWSKIGVTQSMGSRYEHGWAMPKPVRKLLLLVHPKGVAPANGHEEDLASKSVKAQLDPRAIRRKLGVTQVEFWPSIGITQSAGSRYETGRAMPKPVQALLRLVQADQTLLRLVKVEQVGTRAALKNRVRAAPAAGFAAPGKLNEGRTRRWMPPESPNRAIIPPFRPCP